LNILSRAIEAHRQVLISVFVIFQPTPACAVKPQIQG